ncbi:MAG: hypothetical protein ACP5OG_06170 [Candidatus Nanoarchaeia archaeon]
MKIKRLIVVIIIIAIISLSIYFIPKKTSGNAVINRNSVSTKAPVITRENLADYLKAQEIIKELPKNAVILLRFYNFNTGERQWEDSYIIKKSNVTRGYIEDYDVELRLNSKYLPYVYDLCGVVKKAKETNDFGFESKMSESAFLWKYKSMLKYRSCFGY